MYKLDSSMVFISKGLMALSINWYYITVSNICMLQSEREKTFQSLIVIWYITVLKLRVGTKIVILNPHFKCCQLVKAAYKKTLLRKS